MSDFCSICGHVITSDESLARGYGSECAAALRKAYFTLMRQDNEASLMYNWLIRVSLTKSLYLETFAKTKFRSEFKKSFYASMKTAERISKKQLDIMENELMYKNLAPKCGEIIEKKELFFKEWCSDKQVTRKAIEIARKEMRK